MLIWGGQFAAAMSDVIEIESKTGKGFLNPPVGLAGWMIGLGVWGLALGILNIIGLAYPGDLKISWAGFLTVGLLGEGVVYNTAYHPLSDTFFLALCGMVAGIGIKTLNESESGLEAWLKALILNDTWPAMVSFEDGWARTMGAWCMMIGLVFYLSWGILYTGWVDPGVYSVFAALFAFGFALADSSRYLDAPIPKE
jgi:hypothetical protein